MALCLMGYVLFKKYFKKEEVSKIILFLNIILVFNLLGAVYLQQYKAEKDAAYLKNKTEMTAKEKAEKLPTITTEIDIEEIELKQVTTSAAEVVKERKLLENEPVQVVRYEDGTVLVSNELYEELVSRAGMQDSVKEAKLQAEINKLKKDKEKYRLQLESYGIPIPK